jgi:hypothetical protein
MLYWLCTGVYNKHLLVIGCQSVTEVCIVSQFFYTYSTELSAMDAWPNALFFVKTAGEDRGN